MTVIVTMTMTTTVTPAAIAADVPDDGRCVVDAGVTEVSIGMTTLVEARSQIGSLSMSIRTGQLHKEIPVRPRHVLKDYGTFVHSCIFTQVIFVNINNRM